MKTVGQDASIPIWWTDVRASVIQLANRRDANSNPQNAARSLRLLIQMVAEGARFNDIEGCLPYRPQQLGRRA